MAIKGQAQVRVVFSVLKWYHNMLSIGNALDARGISRPHHEVFKGTITAVTKDRPGGVTHKEMLNLNRNFGIGQKANSLVSLFGPGALFVLAPKLLDNFLDHDWPSDGTAFDKAMQYLEENGVKEAAEPFNELGGNILKLLVATPIKDKPDQRWKVATQASVVGEEMEEGKASVEQGDSGSD
jgi:hypothetical protein